MKHAFMEGLHTFLSHCEYCLSSLCSLGALLTALNFSVGDEGFLREAWLSRAETLKNTSRNKYGVPVLPVFIFVENK